MNAAGPPRNLRSHRHKSLCSISCRMHEPIRNEILAAMTEVLDSGSYINGKYVEKFEAELAAYTGTRKAVGVTSGSDLSYDVEWTPVLSTASAMSVLIGDDDKGFRKRLDGLSRVFDNERNYRRAFYGNAQAILRRTASAIGRTGGKKSSLWGMLRKFRGLNRQHLYIILHSLLSGRKPS